MDTDFLSLCECDKQQKQDEWKIALMGFYCVTVCLCCVQGKEILGTLNIKDNIKEIPDLHHKLPFWSNI